MSIINKEEVTDYVKDYFQEKEIPLTLADLDDISQLCEDNMIDEMDTTIENFIKDYYD